MWLKFQLIAIAVGFALHCVDFFVSILKLRRTPARTMPIVHTTAKIQGQHKAILYSTLSKNTFFTHHHKIL